MLDERKSALWQALGLGPEWVLREELQQIQEEQRKTASAEANQTSSSSPHPAAPPASSQKNTAPAKVAEAPVRNAHTTQSPAKASRYERKTFASTGKGESRGISEEAFSSDRIEKIKNSSWNEIISEIKNCHICDISQQRICAVPGEGTPPKDLVLIGEAPGAEENRQGVPFCGPSGKLLTTILHAIGLERGKDLGILNTIKCRPPMNADPTTEEMAACSAFLERQLELMDPKVIVAMGKPAAKSLFGTDETLTSRRQKVFDMVLAGKSRKVIVTYHPAALLRNPLDKRKAWVDWCLVLDTLNKARNE